MGCSLGEVADIQVGFPFQSKKFNIGGEGVHLVRGQNVTEGSLRFGKDEFWWSDFLDERVKHYFLHPGDVVIGMDGSRVGYNYAQIKEADLPALLVQRVACLRAKTGISQDYLYALISSGSFTKYVRKVRTGTTIPHISKEQISRYSFKQLDKQQQEVCGSFCRLIDDLLSLNARLNGYLAA